MRPPARALLQLAAMAGRGCNFLGVPEVPDLTPTDLSTTPGILFPSPLPVPPSPRAKALFRPLSCHRVHSVCRETQQLLC